MYILKSYFTTLRILRERVLCLFLESDRNIIDKSSFIQLNIIIMTNVESNGPKHFICEHF